MSSSSLESIREKSPVRVGDDFRIRYNSDLYELLYDIDVMRRINIQRLLCLGHVVCMEEDSMRDGYLMRGCAEVGEDVVSVGRTKSMHCGRPKSVNLVVMDN